SGYVALLMALEFRKSVARISGLYFLQGLFDRRGPVAIRSRRILWVLPSQDEEERLRGFLAREDFDMDRQGFYQAPFYAKAEDFEDAALWKLAEEFSPEWVIVCIGGGRQEKLACRMRGHFQRRFRIACTGAAIAFFTGGQARIPTWADRMCLGWLFRIFENPKVFVRRYFQALKLPLVLRKARGSLAG
ncbi:MAG: WecB/TagA/CpsF family glycosyltransferase, partial [Chthoniobacterales bacterium]